MKSCTIRLNPMMHKDLKVKCIENGLTFQQACEALLRGWLNGQIEIDAPKPTARGKNTIGLQPILLDDDE